MNYTAGMKRRYRVSPCHTDHPGREWDVIDTSRSNSDAPGVAVATYPTRQAARQAADKLEADVRTRGLPWGSSAQAARAEATRGQRLPTRHMYCVECLRSVGEDPIPGLPWQGLCAFCHFVYAHGLEGAYPGRDNYGERRHPLDVPAKEAVP